MRSGEAARATPDVTPTAAPASAPINRRRLIGAPCRCTMSKTIDPLALRAGRSRSLAGARSLGQLLVVALELLAILRRRPALHRVQQILPELLRRPELVRPRNPHRLLVHARAHRLILGTPLLLHLLLHLVQLVERLRLLAHRLARRLPAQI